MSLNLLLIIIFRINKIDNIVLICPDFQSYFIYLFFFYIFIITKYPFTYYKIFKLDFILIGIF